MDTTKQQWRREGVGQAGRHHSGPGDSVEYQEVTGLPALR